MKKIKYTFLKHQNGNFYKTCTLTCVDKEIKKENFEIFPK